VAVAAELFARKPYDEIYISDIAKEAGVAHGLLFYHFKDKRGLYIAVLNQVHNEIVELHTRREDEDTSEKWLRGVVHRHMIYRRDHAHTMLALMRAGGQDPEIDEVFEQGRRIGAEFLFELLGVHGAPSPQLRVAVRGCMGAADEMAIDWLAHDQDMDIEQLEQLTYTTVVTILSTVCTGEVQRVVEELRSGA
jgi:AcrR family transcriptional regulator